MAGRDSDEEDTESGGNWIQSYHRLERRIDVQEHIHGPVSVRCRRSRGLDDMNTLGDQCIFVWLDECIASPLSPLTYPLHIMVFLLSVHILQHSLHLGIG